MILLKCLFAFLPLPFAITVVISMIKVAFPLTPSFSCFTHYMLHICCDNYCLGQFLVLCFSVVMKLQKGICLLFSFLSEKNIHLMLILVLFGYLQASAFEGSVFTHSDVKPGMLVKAKVLAVENFGAIVQFSSGVKALCPLPHMSEFDIVKPDKKFKVWVCFIFYQG